MSTWQANQNSSSIKRLLLTGSTGFVGRSFCRDYGQLYEIRTVNLRTTPVEKIDFSGVDIVLHLAACVHQMKGAPEETYFAVNTTLTKELAMAAKRNKVRHFIFMSTAHVYADQGAIQKEAQSFHERTICSPQGAYARSKWEAEKLLSAMQDDHFAVSILRSPLIYGPAAKGNMPTLANLIRKIPWLPFDETRNLRSLIFVENLTYFIHLVIERSKGGIFLPQDEKPLSLREMVELLAAAQKKKVRLFSLPAFVFSALCKLRPAIMTRLFGTLALDSTATNLALEYHPRWSTQQGFERMLFPDYTN